ncbi:MAG TPA: hypothetical protein PKC48_11075 [Sphingorhabdus sp.]|uniref:hypothetical protein n=1 Tax=Sphingorhabdus sp. TaxID=1902408 RepID=UPI002D17EE88|nr:hypothetical protein [Sphingorhabdus sp.]HMT41069.1 hypothetical protein [Sphingorhabdus sp.]HMU22826.1 hypothetical protein [Sphingorhabdus sp.]
MKRLIQLLEFAPTSENCAAKAGTSTGDSNKLPVAKKATALRPLRPEFATPRFMSVLLRLHLSWNIGAIPSATNNFIHNASDFANMLPIHNNRLQLIPESALFRAICTANSGSVSRKLARANKGE